ncbi:hypothetical protein SLS57_002084 [Botryosphaeria dothidea]
MECDICGKELAKARIHCSTCARAALYPYRIEQASTLLDRETFSQHVEAVASGTEDRAGQAVSLGETLVDTHESSKRVAVERDIAATEEIQERMRLITEQTELLKRQMEETRREIAARKAAIAQRRSDLESATYNIDKRRAKELDMVKEVIRTVKHADDVGHREDIRSKVWHCKHAADVAGLKQRRRRSRDGQTKLEYYIGGVRIHDLRDLNSSRTLDNQKPLPRPRPLYIDRKLPALANDDPATYALFVEGVTFLAWNVAWLCRSQGQVGGFTEWEEICPIGKNMYKLLVDDAQSTLNALEQEAARKAELKNGTSGRSSGASDVVMGYFSHGMSKGFLGAAEGVNYLKGWRYQTPMRVVDRVKGHLQAEMQGAEWEMLDEKEWEMDEDGPQAIDRMGETKKAPGGTKITSAVAANGGTDEGRGWTKLKSRSEEAK